MIRLPYSAERARSLIFGTIKYLALSKRDQRIVDLYQARILREAPVILPNTKAALEQTQLEQMLRARFK